MGGDPNEDITTRPALYRNFGGKAVRIRPVWSSRLLGSTNNPKLRHSFQQIRNAEATLRRYTLGLDCQPSPEVFSWPLRTLGSRLFVNFDRALSSPAGDSVSLSGLRPDYEAIYRQVKANQVEEDRLVVVFLELRGARGRVILEPDWLPWVVVDPVPDVGAQDNTLLHEIGHACRLGHQQNCG